jgi:hypothetical protein
MVDIAPVIFFRGLGKLFEIRAFVVFDGEVIDGAGHNARRARHDSNPILPEGYVIIGPKLRGTKRPPQWHLFVAPTPEIPSRFSMTVAKLVNVFDFKHCHLVADPTDFPMSAL